MPAVMAKTYQFVLDPFQNEAVKCIERNECGNFDIILGLSRCCVALYAPWALLYFAPVLIGC